MVSRTKYLMDTKHRPRYPRSMPIRKKPALPPITGLVVRGHSYRAQVTLPPDLGQDIGAECDATGASPSEAIVKRLTGKGAK